MPSRIFQQEFECVFNVDAGYAFDWNDITASMEGNDNFVFERRPKGMYVAGVDLGQQVDHTTMSVLEILGPTRRMVFHKVWDLKMKWIEMATDISQYLSAWSPGLVLVDCTDLVGE